MQKGMNSMKEELQRKIHNYQSILRKTDKGGVAANHNMNNTKSTTFDYDQANKFTTLDSNKSKYVVN